MMGKNISVETKDVTKFFGDFQALKGVSADIYEGEVVVILGHLDLANLRILGLLTD